MARAFEQSHAAYVRKDGMVGKELAKEGKAHQREMERLNAEASAWIFRGEYPKCFFFPFVLVPADHSREYVIRREQSCKGAIFLVSSDNPLNDVSRNTHSGLQAGGS